ncbi:hypothetical protein [uncultured Tateyamaria sp.]|uniref:hypothetical protein n=1 Tax=uncultured Tateyamaria sp. TaxID=455651 RepID=UPI0026351CFE|nr:hypothetical protein [uncultured Tateyamaria sp.]
MTLFLVTTVALVIGTVLPVRWGAFGFLAAAAVLFLTQSVINTAMGFEGIPISESLLLFNDSYLSYVGFNLQITYRAFALPLLALATPFIFRLARSRT